jgi:putative hydroxymethylpyrimidine transport system substrate-binding protein
MKFYCSLAAMLIAALLAGCGGGSGGTQEGTNASEPLGSAAATEAAENAPPRQEPVTVWVALDGWETAETLGLVMAEKRGYFTKSKLFVTTLAPVTPALSIPDVVDGSDLIGVAHGPEVVMAKERGAPITILSSLVPHANAAMIWPKKSKIGGIADLEGKTIAFPGLSFQEAFLESILAGEGLTLDDVKIEKVGNDLVPALVKGKADAIFGGTANLEGADLEAQGIEPVITPVRKLGIPDYEELVLVARTDRTEEEPDVMRDFAMATARGAAAAAERPKEALDTLKFAGERNPKISSPARAEEVKLTIPLLSTDGQMSSERMQGLLDWMHEEEMIQGEIPIESLFAGPALK